MAGGKNIEIEEARVLAEHSRETETQERQQRSTAEDQGTAMEVQQADENLRSVPSTDFAVKEVKVSAPSLGYRWEASAEIAEPEGEQTSPVSVLEPSLVKEISSCLGDENLPVEDGNVIIAEEGMCQVDFHHGKVNGERNGHNSNNVHLVVDVVHQSAGPQLNGQCHPVHETSDSLLPGKDDEDVGADSEAAHQPLAAERAEAEAAAEAVDGGQDAVDALGGSTAKEDTAMREVDIQVAWPPCEEQVDDRPGFDPLRGDAPQQRGDLKSAAASSIFVREIDLGGFTGLLISPPRARRHEAAASNEAASLGSHLNGDSMSKTVTSEDFAQPQTTSWRAISLEDIPKRSAGTIVFDSPDAADEVLSEVWPASAASASEDDIARLSDLACLSDSLSRGDGPKAVQAWEVTYESRVVVYAEPFPDAPTIYVGTSEELLFAEEPDPGSDWLRLAKDRGYIMKPTDPASTDALPLDELRPMHLWGVPEELHKQVTEALMDGWEEIRIHAGSVLKPEWIQRLRNASDEAIFTAGTTEGGFDLQTFKEMWKVEVMSLLNEEGLNPNAIAPNTLPEEPLAMMLPVLVSSSECSTSLSPPQEKHHPQWSHEETSRLVPEQYPGTAYNTTPEMAAELVANMRKRILPHVTDVSVLLDYASDLYRDVPTLVTLEVPSNTKLLVVGDLHGQFADLLHIFDTYGHPAEDTWYLFNGDFVDRGQFAVEVVLTLVILKSTYPKAIHLNRGNHEAIRMNALYGFKTEVLQKYDLYTFELFCEVFKHLPLATVVNKSIFVVHGGVPRQEGVRLAHIADIRRTKEPDEAADELMVDLLWSDPMDRPGREKSPRGAGTLFGPDVTQAFCEENGLTCVIRSHEMKLQGYEWHHDGRCLTVFSAANYCDLYRNQGAVCKIRPREAEEKIELEDLELCQYTAPAQLFHERML